MRVQDEAGKSAIYHPHRESAQYIAKCLQRKE